MRVRGPSHDVLLLIFGFLFFFLFRIVDEDEVDSPFFFLRAAGKNVFPGGKFFQVQHSWL